MGPSPRILSLLKHLDRVDTYSKLAPDLTVARRTDFSAVLAPEGRTVALGARGHGTLPGVIADEKLGPLCRAIDALEAEGLPPVFAHVYDETWEPLSQLTRLGRDELGNDYDVLADAWVFSVRPGKQGWRPHRGCPRFDGGRTMLNVWVALTPATRTRSCMWVVPLDKDPAYPDNLGSADVPGGAEVALEVGPGTACVWDANVLHWGGPIAPDAPGPRMSITYTLRRSDSRRPEYPPLDLTRLSLRERLDLIAEQLLKYAHMERTSDELLEWANLTLQNRAMTARVRGL